jgi:hypothetical protein
MVAYGDGGIMDHETGPLPLPDTDSTGLYAKPLCSMLMTGKATTTDAVAEMFPFAADAAVTSTVPLPVIDRTPDLALMVAIGDGGVMDHFTAVALPPDTVSTGAVAFPVTTIFIVGRLTLNGGVLVMMFGFDASVAATTTLPFCRTVMTPVWRSMAAAFAGAPPGTTCQCTGLPPDTDTVGFRDVPPTMMLIIGRLTVTFAVVVMFLFVLSVAVTYSEPFWMIVRSPVSAVMVAIPGEPEDHLTDVVGGEMDSTGLVGVPATMMLIFGSIMSTVMLLVHRAFAVDVAVTMTLPC